MGKRNAVRDNSGLPVDHSGPELGVGPTTPATSGRNPEACPPGYLSQHKSGRRSRRQSLLGAGEASPRLQSEAAQPTSLDPLQTNRNNPTERGRHCGKFSLRGIDQNRQTTFRRVNCKCWGCSYCGPRRAKRYKHAIRAKAEALKLSRFLTLTLDPSKIEGDPVAYLNATFAKFRVYLRRKYKIAPTYIRILEFQKNGNPHFHILIDRYMPQAWLRASWQAAGGGRMVDIRYVDIHRISRYLSKYLTKELLMSAPRGCRRITTSRGIRILEKTPSQLVWDFLRIPFWALFDLFGNRAISVSLDEEGEVEAFSVNEEIV
jgi:hypothetical protein